MNDDYEKHLPKRQIVKHVLSWWQLTILIIMFADWGKLFAIASLIGGFSGAGK